MKYFYACNKIIYCFTFNITLYFIKLILVKIVYFDSIARGAQSPYITSIKLCGISKV